MVNKRGSRRIENETDDVFDETPGHRIKTERGKQVEYEDNFDEASKVNNSWHKFSNIGNRIGSLNNVKSLIVGQESCTVVKEPTDAACSSTVTGKCLNDEDPDDVFDEEHEVSKNFGNITTAIKIEVDEETDTLYDEVNLQENLDFLTVIKQEKDAESSCHDADDAFLENSTDLSIANFITNGEVSAGDGEPRVKVECEESSVNSKYRKRLFSTEPSTEQKVLKSNPLSRKAKNLKKYGKTQMETRNNSARQTDLTSTNNVTANVPHSIGEGRKTQANLNSLIKKVKYVTKGSQKQKEETTNSGIIKSSKQNGDLNVISKTFIENNEDEKNFLPNKNQQSGGNINKSTNSEQEKQMKIEASPEVNTNSVNQSSLEKKVDLKNKVNSKTRNVITTKNKSKKENEDKGPSNRKSQTDSNKINGKEKVQNHRQLRGQLAVKHVSAHIEKSDRVQERNVPLTNMTESKENYEINVENEKNAQTQVSPSETNQSVEEINERETKPHNRHMGYGCTKCSFKAKRKAVLKRHLLKHGIEFSSTITSFLDVIEKAKLYTSQLEKIYDGQEPQTRNACNETTLSRNILRSEMNLQLSCREEPIDVLDNALQIQSVNVYAKALAKTRSEDAFVINLTDKVAERSTYINQNVEVKYVNLDENWSSESEIDHVKGTENNPSINVEYSCANCSFKTKRSKILKRHLVTHGTGLSSGIISFLDLVKNVGVFTNQFGEDSEDKEVLIQDISENWETENKIELDDPVLNISYEAESKDKIQLEIVDNEGSEVFDAVGIIKKNQGTLPLNENEITTNVDNKCERIETSSEAKVVLRTQKRKRSVRRWSVPKKKKKLEVKSQKLYRCDKCSYQSDKKKYIDSHKMTHSNNVVKCSLCDFITNLQRNLNNHMLVHLKPEEIKLHKCPDCPYQSKRKCDLRSHMITHQKPEEMKMFQCDKCPYQSKRKTNLKEHQLRHMPTGSLTSFNCAECSFKTNYKSGFRKHMYLHPRGGEMSWYKCPQCPYASKYNSGLKKHSLIHKERDEIRTYDCPKCPYRAKHNSHLKTHMLLHMDPKEVEMHKCDQCSYKSVRRDNLLAHMLRHKNNEEIVMVKCAQCSFETRLKSNLKKHIIRVHKPL